MSSDAMLRKFRRLKTKQVCRTEDIKVFFDECASDYAEKHGNLDRLINYRISLIKEAVQPRINHLVLDLGCGIGHYLSELAGLIGHGIGIDISDNMIKTAKELISGSPWREKLTFLVDNAEQLSTIADSSFDIIMCIGALEHMPKKDAVLASGYHVLKPGGQFVCLTPNGGYLWYRFIAPMLRLDTKHLSTDTFLNRYAMEQLLGASGFSDVSIGYWTFIPKGDIHPVLSAILQVLDRLGAFFQLGSLRGGLLVTARKPWFNEL
jgi:2-polyprenyl-6-hydroxyphenyl methylase/3-demethylubiquinone-9 3-methyltransferase